MSKSDFKLIVFPAKKKDPLDRLVDLYRRGDIAGLYIAITTKAGHVEQLELVDGEAQHG